jgi:hypothetical protein
MISSEKKTTVALFSATVIKQVSRYSATLQSSTFQGNLLYSRGVQHRAFSVATELYSSRKLRPALAADCTVFATLQATIFPTLVLSANLPLAHCFVNHHTQLSQNTSWHITREARKASYQCHVYRVPYKNYSISKERLSVMYKECTSLEKQLQPPTTLRFSNLASWWSLYISGWLLLQTGLVTWGMGHPYPSY